MKTFLDFLREETKPEFRNLELFHGSNVEFDVFDFEKFGQTDSGTMGAGFYLTGDKDEAQRYAENAVRYRNSGVPCVMTFNVSVRSPLTLDSNNVSAWEDRMRELGIPADKLHANAAELIKRGYDSAMVLDMVNLPMVREIVLYKPGLAKRIG
ncbi:hypothetical protein RCIP0012_00186 [Klebsiella phage RCIP0012]